MRQLKALEASKKPSAQKTPYPDTEMQRVLRANPILERRMLDLIDAIKKSSADQLPASKLQRPTNINPQANMKSSKYQMLDDGTSKNQDSQTDKRTSQKHQQQPLQPQSQIQQKQVPSSRQPSQQKQQQQNKGFQQDELLKVTKASNRSELTRQHVISQIDSSDASHQASSTTQIQQSVPAESFPATVPKSLAPVKDNFDNRDHVGKSPTSQLLTGPSLQEQRPRTLSLPVTGGMAVQSVSLPMRSTTHPIVPVSTSIHQSQVTTQDPSVSHHQHWQQQHGEVVVPQGIYPYPVPSFQWVHPYWMQPQNLVKQHPTQHQDAQSQQHDQSSLTQYSSSVSGNPPRSSQSFIHPSTTSSSSMHPVDISEVNTPVSSSVLVSSFPTATTQQATATSASNIAFPFGAHGSVSSHPHAQQLAPQQTPYWFYHGGPQQFFPLVPFGVSQHPTMTAPQSTSVAYASNAPSSQTHTGGSLPIISQFVQNMTPTDTQQPSLSAASLPLTVPPESMQTNTGRPEERDLRNTVNKQHQRQNVGTSGHGSVSSDPGQLVDNKSSLQASDSTEYESTV